MSQEFSPTIARIIILGVVVGLMAVLTGGQFLNVWNFQGMAFQLPEFGILALAMAIAIISGGIDLSVVATATISGVVAALVLRPYSDAALGLWEQVAVVAAAVLLPLIASAVCGLMNGLLIAVVGIPPVLTTLGTMWLLDGIALKITNGTILSGFPSVFVEIGNGTLSGIPISLLIFVGCVVLTSIIMHRTPLGFSIFMIGANPVATRFSGISNTLVLIRTYLLCGLLSGMAGVVMASRYNSVRPGTATSYILPAIMVAIFGGVQMSGGFGRIVCIALAILIQQSISSGLNLLGVNTYLMDVIWGALLLAMVSWNLLEFRFRIRKRPHANTLC